MFFPTGFAQSNNDDRLRLVGKGDRLLGLVLRHAPPSYQWAQWLRLPLASAASDGDATAVVELLEAGADGKAGPRGPDGGTLVSPPANRHRYSDDSGRLARTRPALSKRLKNKNQQGSTLTHSQIHE